MVDHIDGGIVKKKKKKKLPMSYMELSSLVAYCSYKLWNKKQYFYFFLNSDKCDQRTARSRK